MGERRYRVEVLRGDWISVCGPDYESETEFRVVDVRTGQVLLVFKEYGDWPYMTERSYSGVASVDLGDDDHVVVTHHDGRIERVRISAATG